MAQSDAQDALRAVEEAINSNLSSRAPSLQRLDKLAVGFLKRYRRDGIFTDLEKVLQIARRVLSLTDENDTDRAERLNVLGVGLLCRYEATGDDSDLNEAIRLTKDASAVELKTPLGTAVHLNSLSVALYSRYERTRALVDLEDSIQTVRKAIQVIDHDHLDRASWTSNLGAGLLGLYWRTGTDTVLEEAITVMRSAVYTVPLENSDQIGLLNNFGAALTARFEQKRVLTDVEEAIQIARAVVNATPPNHPDRARWLINLGLRLDKRYRQTNVTTDLEDAISQYTLALQHTPSPVIYRIDAARELLADLAILASWNTAYEASKMAVDLVPKLTQKSLKTSDMQYLLTQIVGLACDAAAMALNALMKPSDALNVLETGRGVAATLIEGRRADVSALEESFPFLAIEFICICRTLETGLDDDTVWRDVVRRRIETLEEFDEIVAAIRKEPGFETFMLPPTAQEMSAAAKAGPIVVVNVSWYRCDAIIVTEDGIRSLELPDLHSDNIDERVGDKRFGSSRVLEWLWTAVAKPVLDSLGFVHRPSNGDWPHVWWVPTGSLTNFPIHAAGHHRAGGTESVLDRVISSYSSSVKAIINGRRRAPTETTSPISGRALLVAMEDTPDHSVRLSCANEEVSIVRNLCKSMGLDHSQPTAMKEDVLHALQTTDIFHFAGHGYTDNYDPLNSYLALQDWKTNPLTIADFMALNLRKSSPFLAYLSACGTGQIKDEKSTDEAIHLISACQIAGFRHVIGTLWEVEDETCVDMARATYEVMRDHAIGDESVSLGLHTAVLHLRDRWLESSSSLTDQIEDDISGRTDTSTSRKAGSKGLVSEDQNNDKTQRDIIPYDEEDEESELLEPLQWVPYVHFGV